MSDHTPRPDQSSAPNDTGKSRRGAEWISQMLEHVSQADVPDGTEYAELETSKQTESEELGPSDGANDTLEQAEENSEESATETEEDAEIEEDVEPLVEATTRPKAEQKRPIKWFEAGLIGSSLLLGATSAGAAIQEAAQMRTDTQPEVTCEATAQSHDMREVPLENSPAEVDPEIEVLSDAHDLEQQRQIEEEAAGRMLDEPTISGSPPPPDRM